MKTIDQFGNDSPRPGIAAIETRLLADYLGTDKGMFSYLELSAVIGTNVQHGARHYLQAARRIVLREKGRVFRPVRNEGLRRLTAREVAKLEDRFQHVRRTHKQTVSELKTVDLAELPEDVRTSCVAKMALAAMTIHTHESKQMKRLEGVVGSHRELDLAKTLEAFRG